MKRLRIAAAVVALSFFAIATNTRGADDNKEAASNRSASIEYRRIFVPAGNVAAWPRGSEKFLPVETADFEAWVAAANRAAAASSTVAIADAVYSARLVNGELSDGRGEWRLSLAGPDAALLSLANTSLSIRDAHWRGRENAPVRLGAWGASAASKVAMGLEVTQSGTLDFAWRAAVRKTPDGFEISWRTPPATSARLMLDLPVGMEPSIDGGLVINSTEESATRDAQADHNESPLKRWTLASGPIADATLRIRDTSAAAKDESPRPMRQELNYAISQRGVHLTATFRFAESQAAGRGLVLTFPDDLKPQTILVDGEQTAWRFIRSSRPDEQAQVVVDFPASKAASQLVVEAWHELVRDERWQLPSLRVRGGQWTSGGISLSVDPAFEVRALAPKDLLQTDVQLPAASVPGPEVFTFAATSPAASLDIEVAVRPARIDVSESTTIAVGESDLTGKLSARLDVTGGNVYSLRGELQPGWNVESIEASPADVLREWFVEWRDDRRELVLEFARAVASGEPVAIHLQGQLRRSRVADPLTTSTLEFVHWYNATVREHLVSLLAAGPQVIEAVGLRAIAAEGLSDDQVALFEEPLAGNVYDLVGAAADGTLRIADERPKFSAVIDSNLAVRGDQLNQTHRLALQFQSGRVDSVLIYATTPLPADLRWIDASTESPLPAALLRANELSQRQLPAEGQLWQVSLPPGKSTSVTLLVDAHVPLNDAQQVSLLSAIDATEQHASITIRSSASSAIELETQRTTAAITTAAAVEAVGDERNADSACYHYDPDDCEHAANRPQILLRRLAASAGPTLIVNRLDLETSYVAGGDAFHRAVLSVENRGTEFMRVDLEEQFRVDAIAVDGMAVAFTRTDDGRAVQTPLPPNERFSSVTLELTANAPPQRLFAGSQLRPPTLGNLKPTVGEWTIRVPEYFQADFANATHAKTPWSWKDRMVGPLFSSIFESTGDPSTSQNSPAGWHAYRTPFVADLPPVAVISQPRRNATWMIAICIFCVACGNDVRRRWPNLFVCLVAAAASSVVLLPVDLAPLAAGGLAGLLLSPLTRWRARKPFDEAPTKTWHAPAAVATAMLAWLMFVANTTAQPQNSTTKESAATPAVHRVLIPMNSEGQIDGTKIFVGEQLLGELLRRATSSDHAAGDWLLRAGNYHFNLRERPGQPGIVAGDCSLLFDLETFTRDASVKLPLIRDEAEWKGATLDGIPCPLEWNAEGSGCKILVAEPGHYQLRLALVPGIARAAARSQFMLSLPRLPLAKVTVDYPASLKGLAVPDGITVGESTNGKLACEVTNAKSLTVHWPRQDLPTTEIQNLRGSGLRWLHVSADGVFLDAKYIIDSSPRPEAITLLVDKSWQLMAEDSSSANLDESTDAGASRFAVRVPIPAAADRAEVMLRFRWQGAHFPGRLQLPAIETASFPTVQDWLAVSAGSDWECEITSPKNAVSRSDDEFLANWNGKGPNSTTNIASTDTLPADQLLLPSERLQVAAMVNNASSPNWEVIVRPRPADSVIAENLQVGAGLDQLRINYRANVTPAAGDQFQLKLSAPDNLIVDHLAVVEAGKSVPIRWSKNVDGTLQIFFGQRVADPYQIGLEAHVTTVREKGQGGIANVAFPVVRIDGRGVSLPVWLYREDELTVVPLGLVAAAQPLPAPFEIPRSWRSRLVGCFQTSTNTPAIAAQLDISRSTAKTAGETLTTLSLVDSCWQAAWNCRLRVERGPLDMLRLRVPSSWAGPFTVRPTCEVETTRLSDRTSVVAIRLPQSVPVGETLELQLRGPLAPNDDKQIAVPYVASERIGDEWQNFVSVPAAEEVGPIAWSVEGAVPTHLPPGHWSATPEAPSTKRLLSFRATESPFHLTLVLSPPELPSAGVRLAETTVVEDSNGNRVAATSFYLISYGLAECELALAAGDELVAINLDGRPAIFKAVGNSRWQVQLGPPGVAQTLEVVSRSSVQGSSIAVDQHATSREIIQPRLFAAGKLLPIDLSLWTVGRSKENTASGISLAPPVAAAEAAELRLERLWGLVETSTPVAVAMPADEGREWFRLWANQLVALRQERDALAHQPYGGNVASQVTTPADRSVETTAKRLDAWLILHHANDEEAAAIPSANRELFADSLNRFAAPQSTTQYVWQHYITADNAPSLQVESASPTITSSRTQQGIAMLAIVIATTIALRKRSTVSGHEGVVD